MLRKVLGTVLLLSVAGVACDDADPPRPRDASADSRRDGGADATRDGAARSHAGRRRLRYPARSTPRPWTRRADDAASGPPDRRARPTRRSMRRPTRSPPTRAARHRRPTRHPGHGTARYHARYDPGHRAPDTAPDTQTPGHHAGPMRSPSSRQRVHGGRRLRGPHRRGGVLPRLGERRRGTAMLQDPGRRHGGLAAWPRNRHVRHPPGREVPGRGDPPRLREERGRRRRAYRIAFPNPGTFGFRCHRPRWRRWPAPLGRALDVARKSRAPRCAGGLSFSRAAGWCSWLGARGIEQHVPGVTSVSSVTPLRRRRRSRAEPPVLGDAGQGLAGTDAHRRHVGHPQIGQPARAFGGHPHDGGGTVGRGAFAQVGRVQRRQLVDRDARAGGDGLEGDPAGDLDLDRGRAAGRGRLPRTRTPCGSARPPRRPAPWARIRWSPRAGPPRAGRASRSRWC